ncbi:hypothetical protein S245_065446, partial [Arachis hypogaea]
SHSSFSLKIENSFGEPSPQTQPASPQPPTLSVVIAELFSSENRCRVWKSVAVIAVAILGSSVLSPLCGSSVAVVVSSVRALSVSSPAVRTLLSSPSLSFLYRRRKPYS